MHSPEHSLMLLGCNFDVTRRHRHTVYPIPPDPVDVFQPDLILEHVEMPEVPEMMMT